MGNFISKTLNKPKHEGIHLEQITTAYDNSSPLLGKRKSLYKAALKGDWDAAEEVLKNDESLMKSPITDGGEIALHVAAVEGHQDFVSKLLPMMEIDDVGIPNGKGCTALCFAAAVGHIRIAQIMLEKNPNLATIKGEEGVRPLYMAALQGFSEMAQFLYDYSHIGSWTPQQKINLLTSAIDSELYAEDGCGNTALQVLAQKPGFCCDMNSARRGDPYRLLDCLWNAAESCEEDTEAAVDTSTLFFIAAESGNDDFLVELLRKDHNLLYKINDKTHSIFHIAVLHRYVKVFNLIYELGGTGELIATYVDDEGNNMLHLAGKLSPRNQLDSIPGAALQMQREVVWYKAVEKVVRPSCRSKKNSAGQTPHEVFIAEHGQLMREAEKFMKQTAKSCMLVTMLIATVVFTTAFTVPGGYDNSTGVPLLEKKKMFMVFPVSEAVATLSSLTSIFMFLSILTSRYSDEDFLMTLPCWLLLGLAALFFSIVAMTVAFCTCLQFFGHGWAATALLVLFGSVPTMFVALKYRLLVTVLRSTYGCTYLFRSYNRLHS
ncbi:ankyrin repeat-containing protein At5g02620-like isoform X2 [Salvia miltiorrhiza]|uniref:ankyrin repeat-containing protein At5g02620-like isoform X2 n=1 Tax=Salvia miltiorrhiza TaxID=226208 RepID=UPI0025ACE765|nr:ankyrin repeat-containing protein At5g02620-like isoform X2 [Salvia miltiorrhiza]